MAFVEPGGLKGSKEVELRDAGAGGRAKCKRGERLISGGSEQNDEAGTPYMRVVDEGPVPVEQAWRVRWASDMGGTAAEDLSPRSFLINPLESQPEDLISGSKTHCMNSSSLLDQSTVQ